MSYELKSLQDLTNLMDEFQKKMINARHIISKFNDIISFAKGGIYNVRHHMDTCDNSFSLLITFKLKNIAISDVVKIIKEKRAYLSIAKEYMKDDVYGFYFNYDFDLYIKKYI